MKRKVIIVTDGDDIARKAVEAANRNVGGRTISKSSGNPTLLTANDIIRLIKKAEKEYNDLNDLYEMEDMEDSVIDF